MKKVLFLNLYDDPSTGGGAEMTLHHLTQGIRRCGWKVVMLSTSAKPGLQQIERDDVRIWRAGLRNLYWPEMKIHRHLVARMLWHVLDIYNLAMQPLLRRVLDIEHPNVVSIHNLPGWSSAAWSTIAEKGIPAVQVLHDSYAICPRSTMFKRKNCEGQCVSCRLMRLPHRRLSKQVSAVVGVSRFILDRHLEQGYFRDVPIRRVIHNARDGVELGVATTPSTSVPRQAIRFGFIGSINKAKGLEYLLKTFSQLNDLKAELWIAGNGKTDYERTIKSCYQSPQVHFIGRVAPRDFYPKVDVVIVPSLWNEPLGMVVAEALAFGKPVIGSRRGGIPEMIRDRENGILFDPDQPGELLAAMECLGKDSGIRHRMSEVARISAQPFLNREAWVARYLDLYKEVTGDSSLPMPKSIGPKVPSSISRSSLENR